MSDRLVWIDCEMTGLDLRADALVEVAALVTDFELNVLGEGIDVIIKPSQESLDQMVEFVRSMHEKSGLLDELDGGTTLADAEEQVLAYIKEHCADGSRPPLAGNTVATDRAFLARDMQALESLPALPDRRRLLDQGALAPVVPPRLLRRPHQAWQPPRARRHPGEHRGAALLPRGGLRPAARPGQRPRQGDRRPPRRAADRPRPGHGRRFRPHGLSALHFSSSTAPAAGHGGYSSAGRAPPCGGGCRGFKSRYSPQSDRAPDRSDAVRGSMRSGRASTRWRARRRRQARPAARRTGTRIGTREPPIGLAAATRSMASMMLRRLMISAP